jgi:type II pantothenate kinase
VTAEAGAVRIGVDVGATLAKIAIEEPGAEGPDTRFEIHPAHALEQVAERVDALSPACVGLTGGGARALGDLLRAPAAAVNEFAAWGAGASLLLRRGGQKSGERYLLVSLGTGTSVLLVDGISVSRVGGTALGGGTVLGLCAALLGTGDFERVCKLAESGDRSRVDLLVSDIYGAGEIPLIGNATASAFGRVARNDQSASPLSPEDLAAAVMHLVAENVALICHGLCAASQTHRVVFGGSTLRHNPALGRVLTNITSQLGREATLLPDGEFAGAVGSLELSRGH